MPNRSTKAVEAPDDERVVGTELVESSLKFRAAVECSRGLVRPNSIASGRVEGIQLKGGVLVAPGDAGRRGRHLEE
jgi:hypothetical protein